MLVYVLHKTRKLSISRHSRAKRQRNVQKSVMHVQSGCFAYEINLLFFDVLVAFSSSDLEVPNKVLEERGRQR